MLQRNNGINNFILLSEINEIKISLTKKPLRIKSGGALLKYGLCLNAVSAISTYCTKIKLWQTPDYSTVRLFAAKTLAMRH
jgi:hypothetical protein